MLSFIRRVYLQKIFKNSNKLINNLEQCFLSSTSTANINLTKGHTLCHCLNLFKNNNNELFFKNKLVCYNNQVNFSHSSSEEINTVEFIKIADKTLDLLTEYFDELVEASHHLDEADVSCQDGVLTVKLGNTYGTYVINRQTPNKQLWLSSPKSGPKRYDFINGMWIYKHDGKSLLQLLDEEISLIVKNNTTFKIKCSYTSNL